MKRMILRLAAFVARILPGPVKTGLYRLGPLTRALRALLNRAAPAGLQEVRVAAGDLRGARLWLDLQREKDLWLGTYEPQLQRILPDLAQPGAVAYDVGANIGYITLLLARAVGPDGHVYAFEPLPENLTRLQTHLARNPEGAWITLQAAAVGASSGRAAFHVHTSGGMGKLEGSAGRREAYQSAIDVESLSLDVFSAGQPPPALVKIDVEGGEGMVLAGMQKLLTVARPVILLELHGPQAAHQAWEALHNAGYRLATMEQPERTVRSLEDLDWKAYLIARPNPP